MSGIIITEVHVHVCRDQERAAPVLGFAKIVLNGVFVVNGIRIIRSRSSPFISFPREYIKKDERAFTICHPISKELNDAMSERILEAYQEAVKAMEAVRA